MILYAVRILFDLLMKYLGFNAIGIPLVMDVQHPTGNQHFRVLFQAIKIPCKDNLVDIRILLFVGNVGRDHPTLACSNQCDIGGRNFFLFQLIYVE